MAQLDKHYLFPDIRRFRLFGHSGVDELPLDKVEKRPTIDEVSRTDVGTVRHRRRGIENDRPEKVVEAIQGEGLRTCVPTCRYVLGCVLYTVGLPRYSATVPA